jgi:predicted transcriptional regulator
MAETTTVRVSDETKERLDKAGNKGDTYDDIINRLLDLLIETTKVG